MHTRRLNRIASYLGSAGLYKEAYQIRKVAESEEEKDELDLAQQGLETNNEFEDLFPTSPDDDMEDMDEGMDEDDMDSSLSEYLDEEGMEPAGEERFDDEDFDPDMEAYESSPHDDDDDDEEFFDEDDMFDDEEEEPLSDEDRDLYELMMNDPDRLMRKFPRK